MKIICSIGIFLFFAQSVLAHTSQSQSCVETEQGRWISRPLISGGVSEEKFDLYFETNRDFDPSYPTILGIFDGQQPTDIRGMAEASKSKTYADEQINIVFIQHRGTYCSKFPDQKRRGLGVDPSPYLSSEVIADFEAIRNDLIGPNKWMITGGSGGALLALQYLSQFPGSIEKLFVSTPPVPGEIGGELERQSTQSILSYHDLEKWFVPLDEIDRSIFSWILNRIGYSKPLYKSQSLVQFRAAIEGDQTAREDLLASYGNVFSVSKEINQDPAIRVRLAEVFSKKTISDSLRYALSPIIPQWDEYGPLALDANKISKGLRRNSAPVLIVGGEYDHVVPPSALRYWRTNTENSKLILLPATHTMQGYEKVLQNLRRDFLLGKNASHPEY